MRAELDRAALNERPRMVLAVLIKATLMRQRTAVVLPDREALCGLLGIAKQHMRGVWREIEDARIATFRAVGDGWECVMNADSSQWACEWVFSREQMSTFLDFLDRAPGQSQGSLLAPEPNITRTRGELAAENLSNQNGYSNPPPVTKLVTQPARQAQPFGKSTPINALKVQGSKPYTRLSNLEPLTEPGLMQRCEQLFGKSIMVTYGANWRLRARENPGKLDRVLNDTVCAMKEGRIKTIPAAYANDTWGRFK